MQQLTRADLIWNRACIGECVSPRAGDRALAALLAVHSVAMNGGILHAVGCFSASELSDAELAYGFFGLESVAEIISRARRILIAGNDLSAYEIKLDKEYASCIPDDDALVAQFENHLTGNPFDFAPL